MKKVISVSIASVALALSFNSSLNARGIQPVYSFKNLGEFNNDSGQEFTKLLVTCNGDPAPRYIQRIVGQEMWCIQGMLESCSKERIESATTACTTDAETLIAKQPSVETAPAALSAPETAELKRKAELRTKLLADQMAVEQEQLNIEARRIELRELELKLTASRDAR